MTCSNPDKMNARYLEANAIKQLGYPAESGLWGNYYLVVQRSFARVINPLQLGIPWQLPAIK
ncbi:alkyl sulfatase dimerization domain-containing protein [Colwellia piezophila]|uniref:alkyl sulfatase dimerization domain-containing protein n=1 Tax=Colwellia piezophila TaxID=211668 RepID=UPI003CCB7C84